MAKVIGRNNPALVRKVVVTNEEIAKFWRQMSVEMEDQLLSAIKAAARVKALNLTEDDYKHYEESLKDDYAPTKTSSKKDLCVGIKHWWTQSKYAYLNQPSVQSAGTRRKQNSSYIPAFTC